MSDKMSPAAQSHVQREVQSLQTAFTAPVLKAYILVEGEAANGGTFSYTFMVDASNPEFKQFLNDWGARRSAQLL